MSFGSDLTPCLNDPQTLSRRRVSVQKQHVFHQNTSKGPAETSNLYSVHPFPNVGGGLGLILAL